MNESDINTLYVILCVLDISLISIVHFQKSKLSKFDLFYITVILFSHVLLYLSLFHKWFKMIDILHYVLFLSIVLAIFVSNIYLQSVVLFLVFLIQALWVYKGKCIMNTSNDKDFWGYSSHLTLLTLFYTIILSIKLGKKINKKKK